MSLRAAVTTLVLAAGALRAQTPATITLSDGGPGNGPRVLAAALSRPYDVIPPATSSFVFRAGATRERTVLVLGRDAVVEGTVHGDVIVVGGDLYMHPGGGVDGSAIAFGGGVYQSSLATVHGGVTAFRDFTYDIQPTPSGFSLRYRALSVSTTPTFAPAGFYGVNIPAYDRTNGVSLPVGVDITPGSGWRIEPRVTYRSQLGRLDPSVAAEFQLDRATTISAVAEYATYSNDTWIRSDLINSLHYLALGNDARNYYRGARAAVSAERRFDRPTATLTPFVALQLQTGRSVRPLAGANGGPWAVAGRYDRDDVLRLNPLVDSTTIGSAEAGARLEWNGDAVSARAQAALEQGRWNPRGSAGGSIGARNFSQLTVDGSIGFPTFGAQRLDFDLHALASAGQTPRERYAYVGGPGTLPTLNLLELGGDELVFALARYSVPLDKVQIPFVGPPTLSLREILGGAGNSGMPVIRQATGVRLAAGFVYGEFLVDPTHHHSRFSVGISAGR